MANEAYIIGAVRTPTGRKKGSLAGVHAADLGAHAIRSLIERTGVDPGEIDDVVFGCVDQVGPLAGDIARTCWLAAGLPEHVPGTTVDRQCGSSQQAVHFAAQAVMSGTQDLIVAGGVQTMNQIPLGAAMVAGRAFGHSDPFSDSRGWRERYGGEEVSQFRAAEMIAAKWNITRRQLEEFALESNRRATLAIERGSFPREIAPINDLQADPARVNVNGGAIALGHPLGATGARLMTSLLHELERRGARYGLQTMCEGGGQANVTIIERL